MSSDVDIAVFGEKISFDIISDIHYFLNEESDLVYSVDIINFDKLEVEELRNHITRVGKEIYHK